MLASIIHDLQKRFARLGCCQLRSSAKLRGEIRAVFDNVIERLNEGKEERAVLDHFVTIQNDQGLALKQSYGEISPFIISRRSTKQQE
jgi:Flp pilus assembly protein TadB